MSTSSKKPRGVENKALMRAMQGLRRSSAALPHDTRPNRARSRQDALRNEIKRSKDENDFK